MTANSLKTRLKDILRSRVLWLMLAILTAIPLCIYGINLYLKHDLQERLTSSVRDVATTPEVFSSKRLISSYEDYFASFNGDEQIEGVFQLSKADALKVLSKDPIISCPDGPHCGVWKTNYKPSSSQSTFCSRRDDRYEKILLLCIDTRNNQATWSVTWY